MQKNMKKYIMPLMLFAIGISSAEDHKNHQPDAADFIKHLSLNNADNTITGDKINITHEEQLLLEKALPVLKKISQSESTKNKFWSSISGYRMESPCLISYTNALKLFTGNHVAVVSSSHRNIEFLTLAREWYVIQENKQDQLMDFLKANPSISVSWIAAE